MHLIYTSRREGALESGWCVPPPKKRHVSSHGDGCSLNRRNGGLNAFLAAVLVKLRMRFANLSQNELLVLMLVSVHDGITINELVALASIPQPNVSRLLQSLIYKDYVVRLSRSDGLRQYSHYLQAYAREQLSRLLHESAEAASLEALLGPLTEPKGVVKPAASSQPRLADGTVCSE